MKAISSLSVLAALLVAAGTAAAQAPSWAQPPEAPPQYSPPPAYSLPPASPQYSPPPAATQPAQPPAAPMAQGGGENIYLIDGTVIPGIVTEFEGLKLKVATNWRGVTKIQLGQMANGFILDINDVDRIDWFGRDDEIKRRVQKALEALAKDESFYQKLTLEGNMNLQFDSENKLDGFKESSNLTIGPGYDMRLERQKYGVYLRGKFDYTYQNGHSVYLHDLDTFSNLGQQGFGQGGQQQQQQQPEEEQNGLEQLTQKFGSFAHAGYKHYLAGTPYFAFGEAQVSEQYEGYDLPWFRALAGVGWGRINNIATVAKVKQVEKYLISNGVIKTEFTRKTQKKLYFIFEQNTNTQAIVQKVIDVLREDGYVEKNKDLTIDQAFTVAQMIDDAFRYRQDGLEAKAGFLYDLTRPSDDESREGSLYALLEWDHPMGDKMQFTQIGMVTFSLLGDLASTDALFSSILDYKYSKELTLQGSNTLVFMHSDDNTFVDILKGTARYYIAESVDVSAELTNMLGNITPTEAIQFMLNLTYTVPLSQGW